MIIVEGLEMDSWTAKGGFTPSDEAICLGHGWSEMGLWILRKKLGESGVVWRNNMQLKVRKRCMINGVDV